MKMQKLVQGLTIAIFIKFKKKIIDVSANYTARQTKTRCKRIFMARKPMRLHVYTLFLYGLNVNTYVC